jgi:PAS domain S-box-containing protein
MDQQPLPQPALVSTSGSQQDLQAELERLYTLSLDMMGTADDQGFFKNLNPAWERTLGFTREELYAQPFIEFVHPDDKETTLAEAAKIYAGATSLSFENRYRCKDGSYRWIQWNSMVYPGVPRIYFIARDITTSKQAEAERERLTAILEHSQDFIGMADLEGKTIYINPAGLKMLGYQRFDEVIGLPISQFHPPEDAQHIQQAGIPTAFQQGYWRGDTHFRSLNGTLLPVDQMIFPTLDVQGKPFALATIATDISARKRSETEREQLILREQAARREAQEAVRLKDLFLATMSHELRTPLNAMIGYQHLMLFSGQLNEDNTHMAERSIANSQRLLILINNILDISRIASGGLRIVPVQFSPRQLAQNIHTDFLLQAKDKGLQLSVEIEDALPETIVHDEERLTQIATNLVGNAIKFTETGQVIMVLRQHKERLIIEVSDTGIGIPPSRQHVIFDDFVQLDNESTRKHQGAGLGLSIVKRLTLLMKGSVRVKSEVGQGSTFTVELPLMLSPELYQ